MKVCFIVSGYPTDDDPEYAFIRTTVVALADLGLQCTVIAPQSITSRIIKRKSLRKKHWVDKTPLNNDILILQPIFLSFSNKKINGRSISTYFREKAVKKSLNKMKNKPDVLYGHFWDNAIIASLASNGTTPVVVVSGESSIRVNNLFDTDTITRSKQCIRGLIAVSTKNLAESIKLGLTHSSMKSIVLPNAVDSSIFHKMDKKECRKLLRIDNNDVMVSFVGAFSERKGVKRLIAAVELIENVKLVLIGKGDDSIKTNDKISFVGSVQHSEIPYYLNATDIFVLPTLAEGCCNAIVEAICCGLPIISSNLEFNKDILNEKNAILIDPYDINAIAEAISFLAENVDLREKYSRAALESSYEFSISERAKKIFDFINSIIC